jgi:hypothetical protein
VASITLPSETVSQSRRVCHAVKNSSDSIWIVEEPFILTKWKSTAFIVSLIESRLAKKFELYGQYVNPWVVHMMTLLPSNIGKLFRSPLSDTQSALPANKVEICPFGHGIVILTGCCS